jgi:hypothetical protein
MIINCIQCGKDFNSAPSNARKYCSTSCYYLRLKKTHCKNGHEKTPENTRKHGSCKICRTANKTGKKARGGQRKDFCKRGHALTPDNRIKGIGQCIACYKISGLKTRANPENKRKAKEYKQRPEVIARAYELRNTPARKAKNAEQMKKRYWSDPEKFRAIGRSEKNLAAQRERNKKPETKDRKLQHSRTPEQRAKKAASRATPEYKEWSRQYFKTLMQMPYRKEQAKKISERHRDTLSDYYVVTSGLKLNSALKKEVPPEVIEIKRSILKLRRMLKCQKQVA